MLLLLGVATASPLLAADGCSSEPVAPGEKEVADLLVRVGATVKSVKPSPVSGLYEILLEKEGRQGILYIDASKKYIIQGAIASLPDFRQVTAHKLEPPPQQNQSPSLDTKAIPLAGAITIGNPKGAKHLYVFTDPDCPYCRKMHTELKKLEQIAPDLAIHIMLFPLQMHPGAYDKARTILESKSRDVLDQAFEGKDVPKPSQESSRAMIDATIKFAGSHGISGTPTLVLPDGRIEVGGRDAEEVRKMLE
jgi:thiol:disulfide interchange protein DsbC